MLEHITEELEAIEVPLVAFIGDVSRTWYVDQYMLMEVMGVLRDANPNVVIIDGGQFSFDMYVEKMAARMGLSAFTYNDEYAPRHRMRDRYDRPLEMLEGVLGLVVFPREKEMWCGLGRVVPEAINQKIPVVSIDRKGSSQLWTTVPKAEKRPSK